MNIREYLLDLQWKQMKHDESYHKDVVLLPIPQRVKHMALHCAKYVGYFFEVKESKDLDRLKAVLVDAFIITLATANALNQDIGADLQLAEADADSLSDLGTKYANELDWSNSDHWLLGRYAQSTGKLAKLCESWDHLENLPFRSGMKECNLSLFKVILAEASGIQFDLHTSYSDRIRDVESRSIFDAFFQREKGM